VADRSNVGAVYTGFAIAVNTSGQAFLFAADDGPNSRIDLFDGTFTFVQSFSDPGIPKVLHRTGFEALTVVKHFAVHGSSSLAVGLT